MGDVYAKIDWASKTNARSIVKPMPLLSEFSGYSEWGQEARRRTRKLYNRPVSSAIDYFVINLIDRSDAIDRGPSGNLRHKLKIKLGKMQKI